jgi:hypothetical protein
MFKFCVELGALQDNYVDPFISSTAIPLVLCFWGRGLCILWVIMQYRFIFNASGVDRPALRLGESRFRGPASFSAPLQAAWGHKNAIAARFAPFAPHFTRSASIPKVFPSSLNGW